jgi:hypothetical protein
VISATMTRLLVALHQIPAQKSGQNLTQRTGGKRPEMRELKRRTRSEFKKCPSKTCVWVCADDSVCIAPQDERLRRGCPPPQRFELAQHLIPMPHNIDTMPKTTITKKSVTWTLDIEVMDAFNAYVSDLKKAIPESMRENTKMQSGTANDILMQFLKAKGYYKELVPVAEKK